MSGFIARGFMDAIGFNIGSGGMPGIGCIPGKGGIAPGIAGMIGTGPVGRCGGITPSMGAAAEGGQGMFGGSGWNELVCIGSDPLLDDLS